MSFQREHIHVDHAAADGIHHSVLFGNAAAPFALQVALQRLRLAKARKRVLLDVGK